MEDVGDGHSGSLALVMAIARRSTLMRAMRVVTTPRAPSMARRLSTRSTSLSEDLLDFGDLSDEPHMIFMGEVPTVMDEDEGLEIVSNYLEETLYEVRDRMKGKGRGKKGKGRQVWSSQSHLWDEPAVWR